MNLNNKQIKTYSAELEFSGKEIVEIPITYKESGMKDRKITVVEPSVCDIEDAKNKLLLEITSNSTFNVIVSAKNQKEATADVLVSPLRQLESESASKMKCVGMEGKYGAVTPTSKLHEDSIANMVKAAQEYLATANYGDFVVEESKVKPKVKSLKELSKLPSKKSGVTYDVSQTGTVTNECVGYFSYNGAKKITESGEERIELRDLKLISHDKVSQETEKGRRVIMAHYSQVCELASRLQVEKLSDCDQAGAALRYNLKGLHSLHTNKGSNPNALSKSNLITLKENLINSEPESIENTIIERTSFVTRKETKARELTHEM